MVPEICVDTGKEIWPTRSSAHGRLKHISKSRVGYKGSIYPCKFCGGWHIGRQKPNFNVQKFRRA